MCVVSIISDEYLGKWNNPPYIPTVAPFYPQLTPEEVAWFKKLMTAAKKYDEEKGEKDCGIEDKKELLRKLAKELGVDLGEF